MTTPEALFLITLAFLYGRHIGARWERQRLETTHAEFLLSFARSLKK